MIPPTEHVPIHIPPRWNKEKDRFDCPKIQDATGDPRAYLCDQIEEQYQKLHRAVLNGIRYFLNKAGLPEPFPLAALTIGEKIDWLEDLICAAAPTPEYLIRFGDLLAYCRWVDSQRRRILRAYRPPDSSVWLTLYHELADLLEAAGTWLAEGLRHDNEDYDQKRVYA